MANQDYSDELLKGLALAVHNGDYFFQYDGIFYQGDLEEAAEAFNEYKEEKGGECTLAKYLEQEYLPVEEYDEHGDYLVLDDSEANEKAKEYIEESLWAFNPSFLAGETGIDQEVFEAIQANDRCESNNPAILSAIEATCGLDDFADSAIGADGRGHFLGWYDGREHEVNLFETLGYNKIFYVYRTY